MAMPNELDIFPPWVLGKEKYSQMAKQAAIELKVFDIIARFGPEAQLSSNQIVSELPTKNPNASHTLERMLRMLTVNSTLTMSSRQCENDNNKTETTYGLTKESRCLVTNANGFSASPFAMFRSEKENIDCLNMLKDLVLNPDNLRVYKAYHGRSILEDASEKPELSQMFIEMLARILWVAADWILESYKGFDSVTELMDVGRNSGRTIDKIVSRYKDIRVIKDLSIIANDAKFPGVEVKHIADDKIQPIPKAQAIFLMFVLHELNDEQCIKMLGNCWAALPDNGKVISVEFKMPQILDNNAESSNVVTSDFMMLVHLEGKERSLAEFEDLAKTAAFKEIKDFPIGKEFLVMEFIKGTAT